ncbi:MAG: hypothetical protein FWG78_04865 [Coriobacteriia bacterium]|nr:hypothetical protein [Coriobacteriia bacterium]
MDQRHSSALAALSTCSRNTRLRHRVGVLLRSHRGQALVEAPVTIFVMCIIVLMVLQLGVWFRAYIMVHAIAADMCRIVAVDTGTVSSTVLHAYAYDRLQALGGGSAFMVPGSLVVESGGTSRGEVSVTVRVRQEALPLVRVISVGLVPGELPVSSTSRTHGAQQGVAGSPRTAPDTFGSVTR